MFLTPIYFLFVSVLSRFLDVDHLLSLCVQIPKQETIRIAEQKITNVIYLKHALELVEPLKTALESAQNKLLQAYLKVNCFASKRIFCLDSLCVVLP